jgi:TolB protein
MNPIARKALLVLAAAAAALSAAGCAANRLDPNVDDQLSPEISGSRVVWEDSRNSETDGTDVYMWSTDTASESLLAGGAGEQDQPAVSDRYAVWIDDGRLRAKDLSSGQVFSVTNGPATQADPSLCGSVVVWTDTANNSDVYAKDLAGGSTIAVATSAAVEAYPACDAGRVVYMYAPIGQSADIRLYNIASGQTKVVSAQPWNEWRPAISGNLVVWQAWPNQPDTTTGIQIFGTNLDTGQDFVVTNGPDNQTAPTISGSMVAWEDLRSGQSQIWWRDLSSSTTEQAVDPNLHGIQQEPALSGNRVAFESNAAGPWNTYLALLPQLQ